MSEELAWAAGLFDGEGSIGCYGKGGRSYFHLRVAITQNDRRVLDRFANAVGVGKVYGPYANSEGRRVKWNYQLAGEKTRICMSAIWPWLSEPKRLQAERAYAALRAGPQPQPVGGQRHVCAPDCTCGRQRWKTVTDLDPKVAARRAKQREYTRRYRLKKTLAS